ncbi:hypothetical protein PE143B_0116565 [Pseudomonas extremaustralis 14-3 substr. 14-3b]|uniref:Uncharacterized protein n=1 Tax=Pseudomonas extremaustralis TaxID=359110 RepID=A0A5C5QBV1_9PSED|nr:hypothetical protein PE143B_0116565 [Pseudomonas extremaustralis 14-3 substr. 14-3b]TWS02256.1 hypothetical protein FIV36_20935 [Pseudomonas extremaustralis]
MHGAFVVNGQSALTALAVFLASHAPAFPRPSLLAKIANDNAVFLGLWGDFGVFANELAPTGDMRVYEAGCTSWRRGGRGSIGLKPLPWA